MLESIVASKHSASGAGTVGESRGSFFSILLDGESGRNGCYRATAITRRDMMEVTQREEEQQLGAAHSLSVSAQWSIGP